MELVKKGYKKTEVGMIPEDWELIKFEDLADKSKKWSITGGPFGSNLKTSDYTSEGIQIIQLQNIGDGKFIDNSVVYTSIKKADELKSCNIFPGEIILSKMGDPVARACFMPYKAERFLMASDGIRLVVDESRFNKYYVFEFLNSKYFRSKAIEVSTGSTRQRIGLPKLKKIPFLAPTLTEQKAIADALTDVDELITNLEKLIAKKKAIKQGAMQQLLTPKEHWKSKTIRELATYRRGSFPQPYGLSKWYDDISGTPFVQVVDVDDNKRLKKETKARISKEGQKYSVFVPKGSIILTIQGSIGRICITDYDAYVDRTLLIFESLIEDFNKYFFMMSIFLKFEIEKEKAPGGIIKTITKEALSSFVISYPVIEEQNYISEILQNMDNEIELLEKKLEKKRIIKQGMMQELLTGKTRLI